MAAAKIEGVIQRKEYNLIDPKAVVVRPGFNPRKTFGGADDLEFIQFVVDNGVKFPPIWVKKVEQNIVLVDGERRVRATLGAIEKGAPVKGIPAIFIDKDANDIEQLSIALTSNNGKPLTALEEAEACSRLKGFGLEESEIAKVIGKSPSHVRNRLVLVQASPAVKQAVEEGKLTQGEAMDAVKESNGDIGKQDEKLQRMKKPSAGKAPKMMGRRKLEKALDALIKKAAELGMSETFGNPDQKSMMAGIMVGLKMAHGNAELNDAKSEIFIAVKTAEQAMAESDESKSKKGGKKSKAKEATEQPQADETPTDEKEEAPTEEATTKEADGGEGELAPWEQES